MARNHARVYVGIWQDEDFLDLRPSQQRLYLFLLSQPNLTHLGVLPLTLRRWGRTAQAYSVDDLRDDLAALEEAGFVVVDEVEEELLVRSLLRNDGIYKQPNVLRSGIGTAAAIHSDKVKRALIAEVDRLDLSAVSNDPPKRQGDPTAREVVEGLLSELREAISVPPENPSPNPSRKGSDKGSDNPSQGVLGWIADTPYACAPARPLVLSPTPTPTPTSGEVPSTADAFDAWWAIYPRKVAKIAARKAYAKAVKTTDAFTLATAAVRFRDDPTRDPEFTPHPSTWLNEGRWEDEGPARPPSNALALVRPTRPSASDAAATAALEAGARVAARHAAREGA